MFSSGIFILHHIAQSDTLLKAVPNEKEIAMANEQLFADARIRILAAFDAVSQTKQTGSGVDGHMFFNLDGSDDYLEVHFHNGVLQGLTYVTKEGKGLEKRQQQAIAGMAED